MWLFIGLTVVIAICIHYLLTNPYGYWRKRGVPFPKPTIFVGNLGSSIMQKKCMGHLYQDMYNKYKDFRYVGHYKIRKPSLLICDPELVKEVLIKNFQSFHDNDIKCDEDTDPILSRNPFCLTGNKWKVVRGQVTANITTVKVKNMFYLMTNVGKNLIEYLKKTPEAKGKDGLEVKELAAKFTTDVVAACAFGLDGKSFIEADAEFRRMGRKFMSPSFWTGMKHTIIILMPSLANFFKLSFVPSHIQDWFSGTLRQTMQYRKENNIVRNDYLDMMLALKDKPGEYEFTDIDVIAQCMTFYVDGFETSSVALSFTLYEIAANPHVQKKLQQEVDAVLAKSGGEITYDAIQEMGYLDNVLSEGLRKYPPGTQLMKLCTKPCTFPPARLDGTGPHLDIEKDICVVIPILALHHDPQYYPDPDKFDPDRFTEENKETRPKHVYLPFGNGPRQCLGYKFAVAQIKAALVSVIKNFEMKVNPKTKSPIVMDPSYLMLVAKDGLWLNFYKRE